MAHFNTCGQRVCQNSKTVVRCCDFHFAGGKVLGRLVGAAMPELQAGGAATQGDAQNLVPQSQTMAGALETVSST